MEKIKRKRKTYGMSGMMEVQALLHTPGGLMRVHFTDGGMNAAGSFPARYTTESFVEQHQIELSREFGTGYVTLLSEQEIEGEIEVLTEEKRDKPEGPPLLEDDEESEEESEDEPAATASAQVETDCYAAEEAGEASATATAEPGGIVEVEFDCNDDAKDWLEEHYGCSRGKLKTRADIIAAGRELGVEITFV